MPQYQRKKNPGIYLIAQIINYFLTSVISSSNHRQYFLWTLQVVWSLLFRLCITALFRRVSKTRVHLGNRIAPSVGPFKLFWLVWRRTWVPLQTPPIRPPSLSDVNSQRPTHCPTKKKSRALSHCTNHSLLRKYHHYIKQPQTSVSVITGKMIKRKGNKYAYI